MKIGVEGYDDRYGACHSRRQRSASSSTARVPMSGSAAWKAQTVAGHWQFNCTWGVEIRLACDCWVLADEPRERLGALAGDEEHGDVKAGRTE